MRVLIVEHHPIVSGAAFKLIKELIPESEISVVMTFPDLQRQVGKHFDFVFSCMLLPPAEPESVVQLIDLIAPQARKIYLSSIDPMHPVVGKIVSQGHLFLPKVSDSRQIYLAVLEHFGIKDRYEIEPSNEYRSRIQVVGSKPLTIRQVSVMELVCQGKTTKEIAVALTMSPDTVRAHLREIYVRLGVSCRVQAVGVYLRAKELSEKLLTHKRAEAL